MLEINIYLMGESEGEKGEKVTKDIQRNNGENLQKLWKILFYTHQKGQQIPSRIKARGSPTRPTTVKCETNWKKKKIQGNSKKQQEKIIITFKGTPVRLIFGLSSEIMGLILVWVDTIKVLKVKCYKF